MEKHKTPIIVLLLLFVVAGGYWYFNSDRGQNLTLQNIPVVPLKTESGLAEKDEYVYPKTYTLTKPNLYSSKIQAYGAIGQLWFGPRGWTGKAYEGADGSTSVFLLPKGGTENSDPHISYIQIPGCHGCILNSAAPFFEEAREKLKKEYDTDPAELNSLVVSKLSPSLVTYSYINSRGTKVYGVANYIVDEDEAFYQAEFALTGSDEDMGKYMVQTVTKSLLDGEGFGIITE
jgi:hypothetical protein